MKTFSHAQTLTSPFLLKVGAAMHVAAFLLLLSFSSRAAAPWGTPIMLPGIGAVTCAVRATVPPTNAYVFGLFDLRSPSAVNYAACGSGAPLWNPPDYHHPSWTVTNIGNIYGITIDADGDIYVAAHGLYSKTWVSYAYYHRYGNLGGGATSLAAAGAIYKIDRNTGVATVFNNALADRLPQQSMNLGAGFNSGPGMGNIAYDAANDQFFISNLEDGKIYRMNNVGVLVPPAFDPLAADTGAAGMPARTERIWGIAVFGGAVYYAVWNNATATSPGKIRRVNLVGGAIQPTSDVEILTVPASIWASGGSISVPVSDITLSGDGTRMVLGERSMDGDTNAYNHYSRVHIAALVGATWTVTNSLRTGCNFDEAYGGVAYGPESGAEEQIIWMSSADTATGAGPHGLFGVRPGDFTPVSSPGQATNAYRVPYDPAFTSGGPDIKGSGGDVEIMQSQSCAEIKAREVHCPESNGAPFTVTIQIKNLSTNTVQYLWFTPCPTSSLPAGAITAQPGPVALVTLPTPLGSNASTTVTVTLPGNVGGQTVCFRVTLLDKSGQECCTEKICVEVPRCDCAEILDKKVTCAVQPDGTIKYTITLTIKNLTGNSLMPFNFVNALFLPPAGFSQTNTVLTPNPIPPGGTGTVQTCYYGVPGPLCFTLTLHDANIEKCCSLERICLDLPQCPPGSGKPDTCAVEEKVPCLPPSGVATVNYTVCNNSTVPRTYTWTAMGTAPSGCTNMLASANFSPSSGSLGPIPPGGCMTVPIQIRCEGFRPGDCAGFKICAAYNAAVPPLCCEGIVYRPKQGEPTVRQLDGGRPAEIAAGGTTRLTFEVENPSAAEMVVDVALRGAGGSLAFSDDSTNAAATSYRTLLTLPPSGVRNLAVTVRRLGDASGSPDFTSVEVWARRADISTEFGEPDLTIPVRLLSARPAPAVAVKDIRLQQGPTPQVIITVPTVAGRLYGLEQASEVVGPWTPAGCSAPDTVMDEKGNFRGTGGDVSCCVPCDPASKRMFFRVFQLP